MASEKARALIGSIVTDPTFRQQLFTDPQQTLESRGFKWSDGPEEHGHVPSHIRDALTNHTAEEWSQALRKVAGEDGISAL